MKNDEHQHIPGVLSSLERVCDECGKKFIIQSMNLYAYKLIIKGHTKWFCRYNCVRAYERKLKEAKGRKKHVKSKKPARDVLEADLKAGLSYSQIGKKHGAAKITAYNWIRSYDLQGLKSDDEVQDAPPVDDMVQTPPPDDMVQHSPTLNEIEQFHTDEPVQELPKVEMNPSETYHVPSESQGMTAEENMTDAEWEAQKSDPITEAWQGFRAHLSVVENSYIERAKSEFREHLREMLAEIVGDTSCSG